MNQQVTHDVQTGETLQAVLTPKTLQNTCSALITQIESRKLDFSCIAFSGFSGALVAPVLCMMMDKYPVVIRKEGDSTHSFCQVEGPTDSFKYIIVDDLMCYGKTIRYIQDTIKRKISNPTECVGLFLYNQKGSYDAEAARQARNFTFPVYARKPEHEGWVQFQTLFSLTETK